MSGLEASNANLWLTNLRWHERGTDAWPQLVVPLRRGDADTADRCYLFSAGTGRMTQVAMNTTELESGDFDGDGIEDWLLYSREDRRSFLEGGLLQVARGFGSEAWRQIPDSPLISVGDLDGDGVRDLVTRQSRQAIEAISGSTGEVLWRTAITTPSRTDYRVPSVDQPDVGLAWLANDHDLNGDGVADLLLVSDRGNTQSPRPLLVALSGRTGRWLWQSELSAQVLGGVVGLDCLDLDGDGELEVVVVAACDQGTPRRPSFGSEDARLWLVVASGKTGQTRWAEPLTLDAKSMSGRGYRYEDVALNAAYADLNRDGVLDIVLPGQRSAHDLSLELRGISGRDGQILWRSPLPLDRDASEALANLPPPLVGDLRGQGQPEVLALALVETRTPEGKIENRLRVESLDGATGQSRWQWSTLADRWRNQSTSLRGRPEDRLRAVLLRRRAGGHWIAVRLWNQNHELHLLDDQGRTVARIQDQASFETQQNRIWPIDVDDDGDDELLLVSRSELRLLRPDRPETPWWQRSFTDGGLTRILGIFEPFPADQLAPRAQRTARGPIAIVQSSGDQQTVRGIEAATGRLVWASVGPTPTRPTLGDPPPELLNIPTDRVPPRVAFRHRDAWLVRHAAESDATTADGFEAPLSEVMPVSSAATRRSPNEASRARWDAYSRSRATPPSLSADPRLLRPLPWTPSDFEWERMSRMVMWAAFYGLTLALVPIVCWRATLRSRQVSLKALLAWPAAVAIVIVGLLTHGPTNDYPTVLDKLSVAYLVAGPVLFTLFVLLNWLRLGRWRIVASWLVVAALATLFMMALSLGGTYWRGANALQSGERYTWEKWYWMAVPVFYLASWALSLGVILQELGRGVGRGPSRLRRRPRLV